MLCAGFTLINIMLFVGCGSSEETTEKKEEPSTQTSTPLKTSEQATKEEPRVDTVNVNVQNSQQPVYDQKTTISTQHVPLGKFSVQIGAYKMPDNADRVAALARERFGKSVYTVQDKTSELYKVFVGDFTVKDDARKFRDEMAQKYPSDYKDAWVSELSQK